MKSAMFHVKHFVLPEWFLKDSRSLSEPSDFDVEESKVSALP